MSKTKEEVIKDNIINFGLRLADEKEKLRQEQKRKSTEKKGIPPRFKIKWWHRHDPFPSGHALYLDTGDLTVQVVDAVHLEEKQGETEAIEYLTNYAWFIYRASIAYANALKQDDVNILDLPAENPW